MSSKTASGPRCVALLGLGEANTALARGLCAADGWRAADEDRRVLGIDIEFGAGTRGKAMAECAASLDLDPAKVADIDLDAALKILNERVIAPKD